MRISLPIRDLIVASWRIEREQAERLLPAGLQPATLDGSYLISLVGMRHKGGRAGPLPVPAHAQLNLRTYVAHEREEAVYFLFTRVTVPGLAGALLGAPYAAARIAVRAGSVEAPGLGVSLRYRVGEAADPGSLGRLEIGVFGRRRLRVVRVRRSPANWRRANPEGALRADPILHLGIGLEEPPSLIYAEEAELELDGRPRPLRSG